MAKEEQKALTSVDAQEYCPAAAVFVKNINECIKMDDIEKLVAIRNANPDTIRALKEFQARAEFAAKQVKEFLVRVCTPNEETLPAGIKWNKQSYTSTFANPLEAALKLIELEGVPMQNFLQWLTPKQAAEAAGITEDRLRSDIGDMIVDTPKARTLSIK